MTKAARQKTAARSAAIFTSVMLFGTALTVPLVTTGIYRTFFGVGSGMPPVVLATLSTLLAFVMLYWRWLLIAIRANPQIASLVVLAPLSVLWSIHPPSTIERSVPLLVTSAFGLTLGGLLSFRQLIYYSACVMAVIIFASLAAIVLVPSSQGIGTWADAWNGVHNHKNGLGSATMFAATLSASVALLSRGTLRKAAIVVLLVALFLLIGSQSRTSQLTTLIALTGVATAALFRRYALLWATAYLIFTLSAVAFGAFLLGSSLSEPIFEALERKPTLSGRLPLWGILWPWVEARPWFGYGYMAFWRPDAAHVVAMGSNPKLFFSPFYSHSGALEVLLAVGWFGLTLLIVGIWKAIAALMVILRNDHDRLPAAFAFVLLIGILSQNITESFMLDRAHFIWILLLALTTRARLDASRSRASRAREPIGAVAV